GAERERALGQIRLDQCVAECRLQVRLLPQHPLVPEWLAFTAYFRIHTRGEIDAMRQMRPPDAHFVIAFAEASQCKQAHAVEQAVTRWVAAGIDRDQRLVDESTQQIQRLFVIEFESRADGHGAIQRPAAGEYA